MKADVEIEPSLNERSAVKPESAFPNYQYDAFISYSNKIDYNNARKVESFLEAIHRLTAPQNSTVRRLQICRDGSDFKLPRNKGAPNSEQNNPVWEIIRSELAGSRYLIVLCSPGAVDSPWVSKEISWMLKHRGAEWVLPVVTQGKDPVNNPHECFPAEIRETNIHQTRIWYDLRGYNPAADAIKVRDYEDELIRLAGDLLEWEADKYGPLAAIWEREQLKRRRRQATIAIVAAAVLIAVAAVAIWQAFAAKRQARRAQANAIVQTADASFDPLTAALLLTELSPEEEPEGGMRVAERLASSPLPQAVMRGHTGEIKKVAFSPDQKHILTASADGTTRIWSVDGRGDPTILNGHTKSVTDAVFSSDGSLAATASEDQTARVWQINKIQPVAVFNHGADVESVQFTFDNRWLVSLSEGKAVFWQIDGTACVPLELPDNLAIMRLRLNEKGAGGLVAANDGSIWSFELNGRGESAVKLLIPRPSKFDSKFPSVSVNDITFSPDGSHVALLHDNQALIQRLDYTSKPVPLTHEDRVNSLRFNQNGSYAVTASSDGRARVWNTATGDAVNTLDPKVRYWVVDLFGKSPESQKETALGVNLSMFTHDGSRVLTFADDGIIRLWDVKNASQPLELRGHLGAQVAAFNNSDTQLVVGADDGTARVWSLKPPAEPVVLTHLKPIYGASFNRDASKLITASSDGIASVWLLNKEGEKIELNSSSNNGVKAAIFSRTDSTAVTVHKDGAVKRWDINETEKSVSDKEIGRHQKTAHGVRFSPDEKKLLTWSEDGTARIWSMGGQSEPIIFNGKAGNVWHAEFSPDGTRVLATYDDGTARVWEADDANKCTLLGGKNGHTETVFKGAFSPDGTKVLTVSQDGTARIWQSNGAGQPKILTGVNLGQEWLENCAYSPNGKSVVTTSSAGRVWIWRADGEGQPIVLRHLNDIAHIGSVTSLVFSPDGQRLVTSGGMDAAVRVWRADGSGRPINLVGHVGAITDAKFSVDGTRVVSASEDGTARIWRIRWSDLIAHIRSVSTATLTVEQRMILLGETEQQAREAYETNERQMGRTPLPSDWKFNYMF